MADAPAKPAAKGGKILGMPRTTGIIVLGIGAVVVGYFVISRMSGSKSGSGSGGSGSGGSGGSAGGGGWWGSGGGHWVQVVKEHQGHKHKGAHSGSSGGVG